MPPNQRLRLSGAVFLRMPSSCGLVHSSPPGGARAIGGRHFPKALPVSRIVAVLFLAAWASLTATAQAQRPTARTTLALIRRVGTDAAIDSLGRSPPAWQTVLKGIVSGDSLWLETYLHLIPNSTAHPSEELGDAFIAALPNAPALVLTMAARGQPPSIASVGSVCGMEFDTEDLDGHIARSRAALRPLATGPAGRLHDLALACLADFDTLQAHLRN